MPSLTIVSTQWRKGAGLMIGKHRIFRTFWRMGIRAETKVWLISRAKGKPDAKI
jgi:hypothetical protein